MQIRALRRQGASDSEICSALNLSPADVAVVFSGRAQERALEVIEDAMESENPLIALRAAQYIRDDAKGRLDKGLTLQQVSLTQVNQVFTAMHDAEKKARELYASIQSEAEIVTNDDKAGASASSGPKRDIAAESRAV